MKKFVLITIGAALILAACNSNSKTDSQENAAKVTYADTVGFAAFQQWKLQNELQNADYNQQPAQTTPAQNVVYRTVYRDRPARTSGSNRTVSNNTGGSTSNGNYPSTTTAPAKKKGISKAAKGAAIGAAGGAVIGAVINKRNRVAGGVIGGVLGGVVGYGIGRGMDKKDGRYLTTATPAIFNQ